jgi:hypothetical protein
MKNIFCITRMFFEYISSDSLVLSKEYNCYIFARNLFSHFYTILNITHQLYYCCSVRRQFDLTFVFQKRNYL